MNDDIADSITHNRQFRLGVIVAVAWAVGVGILLLIDSTVGLGIPY